VQPDRRNQKVRQLTYRIQERLARPLQDGELGDEPSQDHQRSEGAVGPPSPRHDASENVREGNPADQQDAKGGLVELIVQRSQRNCGCAGCHARDSECPQQGWLGSRSVPLGQQGENCSHPNSPRPAAREDTAVRRGTSFENYEARRDDLPSGELCLRPLCRRLAE
jgi:hypothetical protein